VGRLSFYTSLVSAGRNIEAMLGELHGAYNFQSVVNDMWFAIQEMSRHPDGFATRQLLLSTANSFLNKSREVYQGLVEEQNNLDRQIRDTVNQINHIIGQINRLNVLISGGEMAGDNANDFRDQRNLLLDELAELIPLEVRVNTRNEINIISMGHELLANGHQSLIGLRHVSADFNFVIPVMGTGGATISADTPPTQFVNFMHLRPINDANGNDTGKLMALLLARGMAPANYASRDLPSPADVLVDAWNGVDWTLVDDVALAAAFPANHPLRASFEAALANPNNPDLLIAFNNAVLDLLADPLHNGSPVPEYTALQTAIASIGTGWDAILAAHADFATDPAALAAAWLAVDWTLVDDAAIAAAFPTGGALRILFDNARTAAIANPSDPALPGMLNTLTTGIIAFLNNPANSGPPTTPQYDALQAAIDAIQPAWDQIQAIHDGFQNSADIFAAQMFNYDLHRWSIEYGMIPRIQQNLDSIVNAMVSMLNDALTGQLRDENGDFIFQNDDGTAQIPWNLNGVQEGIPLFVRRYGTGPENPADMNSLFSIENLMINPVLLQPGGHNRIALSLGRDEINDTRILEALQLVWRSNEGPYTVEIAGRHHRVQDAYIRMVNQISIDINEALRYVDAQSIQVIQADNRRQAIKGVSMDEELTAMLRFQYAFQAASRVINVLDSMIETIVNVGRR
jgi:flagellar hook-associated protein FlgK